MWSVKAANGIGGVIGTAFAAPIKTIFGASFLLSFVFYTCLVSSIGCCTSATINPLSCKVERSSVDIKIGFNSILFAFSPCVYSWLVQLITDVMLQALVQPSSSWANYLWKLKIEINYVLNE